MSLNDYYGSLPQVLASIQIERQEGRAEGIEEGYVRGYEEGRVQGYQEGRNDGWDAGVEAGNVELLKADKYIRQHVQDKEALREAIVQRDANLVEFDVAYAALQQENTILREAINKAQQFFSQTESDRQLIQKLKSDVVEANEKLQAQTNQYADIHHHYTHGMLLLNTLRGIINDLTRDDELLRKLFIEKYVAQVKPGSFENSGAAEFDIESIFDKELPTTNQFIFKILGSLDKSFHVKPKAKK